MIIVTSAVSAIEYFRRDLKRTVDQLRHADNDAQTPPLWEAFDLRVVGVLDGLVQHSVQALDEGGWVFQGYAFEQQCLVEEEPRGVFYLAVAGVGRSEEHTSELQSL